MSTGLYEIITTGVQVKEDGMVPLLAINNVRLTGTDQILKSILDYCLSNSCCDFDYSRSFSLLLY